MSITTISSIHLQMLPDAPIINQQLLTEFWAACEHPEARRSHFFYDRFENLYIDKEHTPTMVSLLTMVEHAAQEILKPTAPLRCGYWFNLMRPGQQTSLHSHEEEDELLSAVYYIVTPAGCGDLILGIPPLATRLKPVAGMLALFSPQLPHAVEVNTSGQDRLAVAFNIGPA